MVKARFDTPPDLISSARQERSIVRVPADAERAGIVLITADRRFSFANAMYSRILGLPQAKLIGHSLPEVLGSLYEEAKPWVDRAFAGERVSYELQRPDVDGSHTYLVSYEPSENNGRVDSIAAVVTDITEMRRVRESATRYAAIVESSDDAIIGKDLDGIVSSWNPGAERLFGYTSTEIVGKSIMAIIPEDRRKEEQEILQQIAEGRNVLHFRTHRLTKAGARITVALTASPIRDENGFVVGVSAIARDMTGVERTLEELVAKESELRLERDRAQVYLDTAGVILLALDMQGRVSLINKYGSTVLGWSEEELTGRDFIDTVVPERLRAGIRERLHEVQLGDDTVSTNPVVTRSGEERVIEWRTATVRDDNGATIGTLASGTDVTERHNAIESLRVAEERMRFAMESAWIGIWDVDFRTGKLRASEIMERQFGIEPGTFAGTFDDFFSRIHPSDREASRDVMMKAEGSGGDFGGTYRAVWPNGTVRWLTNAGRMYLDDDGNPVRGVGISLDVTEQHSLEQQYHQAQKMEAVGRLAGGIAHDFNNLLTAILGYCQLLLSDFASDDPRAADIAEIKKAGESAAALTRQLLAFSRKQIVDPELINMSQVVGDLHGILMRLIGEDVEIKINLSSTLSSVTADRGQMEQVLVNLVVNARDAMPQGGTLTIETTDVELDDDYTSTHFSVKPGRYVALTVTDTGLGMSDELQSRLFEPFFTTKEPGKGTGLGLATVHGVVTNLGGSVGVYSEVGKGSSFKVYLPVATSSDAGAENVRPVVSESVGNEIVLVVEDADVLRDLTKRMLERLGYTAFVAGNASEAFEMLGRMEHVDVMLTDVVMPGGSGPELAERVKGVRGDLKVIYMSGYTEDVITNHGVLKPGIAFINKPFTAEALGRKIRETVDQGSTA